MPESIQLINHSLDNNLVCQRKDNGYINATVLDDYSRITDEQGRTLSQEQIAKFTTSTPLLTIYNAPRVQKLKDAAQEEKAEEEKKPRRRRTARRGK